jgi:hypothetical protein
MLSLIRRLLRNLLLSLYRSREVARVDGMILINLRENTSQFREVLLAALQLLKETDPRRYRRVQKHIVWIVNETLAIRGSAQYRRRLRVCSVDLLEPSATYDLEYLVGYYASTLVHEATHGAIDARGIRYTPELRSRIERLCTDLAERLHREYDATDWAWTWNATRAERAWVILKRLFSPDR